MRLVFAGLLLATSALAACEGQQAAAPTATKKTEDAKTQGPQQAPSQAPSQSPSSGKGGLGSEEDEGKDDADENDGKKNDDAKPDGDGDGDGGGGAASEKKRVTFAGSRGDTVPGYLWLPKRKSGQKFPAVLVLYGIKGNKDSGDVARAAEVLNAAGFVAMTIDWPGTGERGNIGNTERITKADVMQWTVGDYKKSFDFLAARPEVDGSRMGFVGASMGAMTGLNFAADDARVKAIVPIVPIPNPLWGAGDPSQKIRAVSPRPVLCIYTSDNSDMSGSVCNNVGGGGEKKALPGGHELEGFKDQVVEASKAFLVKHLKP